VLPSRALLRAAVGVEGNIVDCSSGSLLTDDVGDTITDRPAREPPDSGLSLSRNDLAIPSVSPDHLVCLSASRDDLAGRARLGDVADVLDDDPLVRARSSDNCGGGSSDGGE